MDLSWLALLLFGVFALVIIIAAGVISFLVAVSRGSKTSHETKSSWPDTSQSQTVAPPAQTNTEPIAVDVPYGLDRKPMPQGDQPDSALPDRVGPFQRSPIRDSYGVIYAEYSDGSDQVSMELGICDSPSDAQDVVNTYKLESADVTESVEASSIGTEPSFHQVTVNNPRMGQAGRGVGLAWTRGRYYFSARARTRELLDRFTAVFPY